jgi:hypothetical protein
VVLNRTYEVVSFKIRSFHEKIIPLYGDRNFDFMVSKSPGMVMSIDPTMAISIFSKHQILLKCVGKFPMYGLHGRPQ